MSNTHLIHKLTKTIAILQVLLLDVVRQSLLCLYQMDLEYPESVVNLLV